MKKKNNFLKFIVTILFIASLGGVGFVYLSPQFEQNKPEISLISNKYWNLKDSLKINIKDESSIKYYKITFVDGKNDTVLTEKIISSDFQNSQDILINPPKLDMFYKGTNVKIKVIAIDNSKWNFLNGNESAQTFDIFIDKKKPTANIIANSQYIKRGGSAVVVVKVEDENLENAYISFNNKTKFKLTPFYKENYYAALIAWDISIKNFNVINLIAIDKASNKTITKIPFYIQKSKFKKDTIHINKKFIQNVSAHVLEQSSQNIPSDLVERFIHQNSTLRKENLEMLRKISLEEMDYSKKDSFSLSSFKRLRGSKTVAQYGEKRIYMFENKQIDEQWHLGMDWAKVINSKVKSSNDGKVVFNSYLGIYGNTVIIDHGLGLASLYAHLSNSDVSLEQDIYKKTQIGSTGTSGAVLGDHLHFGILIQGIEVDPIEWMDRNWIKLRISNIIKQAKKSIDKK
jgi:murein DD-endopeptidase MepM/ murein hydrolase activator NlpD